MSVSLFPSAVAKSGANDPHGDSMMTFATHDAEAPGRYGGRAAGASFHGVWWRRCLAVWGMMSLLSLMGYATELKVAGSDLLGRDFEVALQAFAKRENQRISTAFQGSRAGLDALKAGTVDIAIVALAPDEKLPTGGIVANPLAYRIAVVVAPEAIELTQISFIQLEGFFGASGLAGYMFWRDLGVAGKAAQLTVTTHVLANREDAVSVDIFRHVALRAPRLKSSIQRHEQLGPLKEKLATEEGGLAILPKAPASDAGMRVLSVSKGEGEPAFGPTPENIHTGDYPLRIPVFVVYRDESAQALRSLLKFLWSDETARSLSQGSYCVPVPPSGRPLIR
jgi:ABC-type phosphate transport system substrate-binding protein